MTDKIVGSGSLTLPKLEIVPPRSPQNYLGVARGMMPGVMVLAAASPVPALSLALVAAHTLECLLKAYVSKDGSTAEAKKLGHNLEALWALAFKQGLRIPELPPDWVRCLSDIHKHPYYLRYADGIHGIITPRVEPMTSELAALLKTLEAQSE